MKYGINVLEDFAFGSKTVFARLDLNSPFDRKKGTLRDITRIKKACPTISELSDSGAKLVLLTHQGGDLEYHNFVSTRPHAEVVSELTGKKVLFLDDVCGPAARTAIGKLKEGQILMLDNVRYMAEEMTLFETKLKLSPQQQADTIVVSKLGALADIYVCDAFAAAHRSQPTLVGFPRRLPSAMGRLFEAEYSVLSSIMQSPKHPCLFLLGGAKIEDAFNMMPKVLGENIADRILACGLLAQLFMMALDTDIGKASEEIIRKKKLDDYLDQARSIWSAYTDRIMLPVDFAYAKKGKRHNIKVIDLPASTAIADIGNQTIDIYKKEIGGARTVFVNGPAGVFEDPVTEKGTKDLLTHIAGSKAYSVIGGGDSVTAINQYGIADKFSYVCTGGGAMVRFLSGEELPVVAALKEACKKFGNNNI